MNSPAGLGLQAPRIAALLRVRSNLLDHEDSTKKSLIRMTEAYLRACLPVFINSFNQPTFLRDMVDWFHRHGFCNVTVMDNGSKSPKLLAYFRSADFKTRARLVQQDDNKGPRRTLLSLMKSQIGPYSPFIFSDPDLWLPENPADDFLTRMFAMGHKYSRCKVGLALDISHPELFRDITVVMGARRNEWTIQDWEQRYWNRPLEDGVYDANVDTTFFLNVPFSGAERELSEHGRRQGRVPALRMGGAGFVARHRPWYKDDGQPKDERAFYVQHANGVSTWTRQDRQAAQDGNDG